MGTKFKGRAECDKCHRLVVFTIHPECNGDPHATCAMSGCGRVIHRHAHAKKGRTPVEIGFCLTHAGVVDKHRAAGGAAAVRDLTGFASIRWK